MWFTASNGVRFWITTNNTHPVRIHSIVGDDGDDLSSALHELYAAYPFE